jgi:hypothetical protein
MYTSVQEVAMKAQPEHVMENALQWDLFSHLDLLQAIHFAQMSHNIHSISPEEKGDFSTEKERNIL